MSNADRETREWIEELVAPIRNDLLSGAAEIVLQAIVVFKTILSSKRVSNSEQLIEILKLTGGKL